MSLLLRWGINFKVLSRAAAAKLEVISNVRKMKDGAKGAEAPNPDAKEVEKTFCHIRLGRLVLV
jgi:hypothetical protein